jgi:predicted Rossmann-fold nucleotide-binding protein
MIRKERTIQVSVVGGSNPDPETVALAVEVGKVVAEKGAVLICGGLGGVMEAILVAASGDILIALPGSHGTRSEVSVGLLLGKRVIGVKAWGTISGVRQVNSLKELNKELMPIF